MNGYYYMVFTYTLNAKCIYLFAEVGAWDKNSMHVRMMSY